MRNFGNKGTKRSIKCVLGIKEMGPQGIYLGNSLVIGNNRKNLEELKKCA